MEMKIAIVYVYAPPTNKTKLEADDYLAQALTKYRSEIKMRTLSYA